MQAIGSIIQQNAKEIANLFPNLHIETSELPDVLKKIQKEIQENINHTYIFAMTVINNSLPKKQTLPQTSNVVNKIIRYRKDIEGFSYQLACPLSEGEYKQLDEIKTGKNNILESAIYKISMGIKPVYNSNLKTKIDYYQLLSTINEDELDELINLTKKQAIVTQKTLAL